MTPEQERLIAALDKALAARRAWLHSDGYAVRQREKADEAKAFYDKAIAELESLHAFTAAATEGLIP